MALVKNNNRNLVQVSGGGSVSGSNNVKPAIQTPPKNTSIEDYQKAEQIVNNPAMNGMSGLKGGGAGNGPAITQIDGASKVSAPTVTPTTPPTQNLNNASPANVKPTTTPSIVQVDSSVKNGTPTGNNPFAGGNINKNNDKSFVNGIETKPVNTTGMENKETIEEKVETESTPTTQEVVEEPKEEVIDEKAQAREEAYQAKKDSIMQHYQDQVDKLNKNTLNAKNEAHQAQQLASKYAENGLKQMGLNNTGLTESSNQANINNYMNAISGINNTKAETQASLDQEYKDSLANLEEDRANEIDQEEAKKQADLEKQEANTVSQFEKMYEYLGEEEREAYLQEMLNNENLSQGSKDYLQRLASAISNTEAQMKGTVKEQKYDQLDTMDQITETGEFNGKPLTDVQKEQVGAFREEMANATTQEEIDDIEDRMMDYLYTGKIDGVEVETKVEGIIDVNQAKVNTGGDSMQSNGDRRQGNDCSLVVGGQTVRVQTGQAVAYDSELDKKLESYGQQAGTLAVVDGVLYVRDKQSWYVVEPRPAFKGQWDKVKDSLGLSNYNTGHDLGKNGFDNSGVFKNNGERNPKSEKEKINELYGKTGANITIK